MENARNYFGFIDRYHNYDTYIKCLCGNKCDGVHEVTEEDIKKSIERCDVDIICSVSAKENIGIDQMFIDIIHNIIAKSSDDKPILTEKNKCLLQ